MDEIKIRDIKQLVDIPDYSLYIYMFLWIMGIVIVFIILFISIRYFLTRKKNKKKEYYKILKNIDLSNSKKAAYTITKYARLISQSDREKKLSNELIEELESYKYKKDVKPLDDEFKILFGRFMDNVDV